jgi:hypothetical protein
MWSNAVPRVGPVGFCWRRNTSMSGKRTTSMPCTLMACPPSVSAQNFLCASMLVTFR